MKDIKCPNCGTMFQVDDSIYAAILEQVRSIEFNNEVDRRMAELREQFKTKEEAVRTSAEKDYEKQLSQKDIEMGRLETELARLKGIINNYEATKKSEISELENAKAKEIFDVISAKDKLIAELESQISNSAEAHKVAILEERNSMAADVQQKEKRIIELESKLESDKLAM